MNYHAFHDSFTGDIEHSGIFDLFPKISKKIRKQVRRFGESWRQLSKLASQRFRGPDPSYPSLLQPICHACVNSQLSPTPLSPPRGRDKKNVTKMNFSSCSDHSLKWIINDCYIFFPYLRVWVFLFLWTSFFIAQHVGPMLQRLKVCFLHQFLY